MRRPHHLVQAANGLYYVRVRVPHTLRQQRRELPSEIRIPTGVRNRRAAARIAREVLVRLQLRPMPGNPDTTRDVLNRTDAKSNPGLASGPIASSLTWTHVPKEMLAMFRHMCCFISAVNSDGSGRLEIEPNDPPEIRRVLLRAIEEATRLSASAATDAPPSTLVVASGPTAPTGSSSHDVAKPVPAAYSLAAAQGLWLFDVALKFRDFHIERNLWKTATTWTNSYEPILRVCRELISHLTRTVSWTDLDGKSHVSVISDIPMDAIHRAMIVQLAEDLMKFPGRQGKRSTTKDAKLILAGGGTPQSLKNALKMMERFATFLRWAADNGYVDAALSRQAAVLSRGADGEDGGARAFDQARLKKIFESLSYRDDSFKRAYCYWSPLMGAFTGGRLAELAGLTVEDFIDVNGIPCVWFRDTPIVVDAVTYERRVKSRAGVRQVPLHPTLIALGLLDYVAVRKAAGAVLLFDGLTYAEKSQWSRNIGQWFQKYGKHMGFHADRTFVFHSFRSNFYQMLRHHGLDDVFARLTLGHEVKTVAGMSYNTDAKGNIVVPIPTVYAAVAQITYGVTFYPTRRWSGQP